MEIDRRTLGAAALLLSMLGCSAEHQEPATPPAACPELSNAPLTPEVLLDGFGGSEDIAIDAQGKFVARRGPAVVEVLGDGSTREIAANLPDSAGLRFLGDGSLVMALFAENRVLRLAADGTSQDLVTDIMGPNGVFPDLEGRVWVTATTGNELFVLDSAGKVTDIATGYELPNGIVFDPERSAVFVTELGTSKIERIDVSGSEWSAPTEVATLPAQALPDGAALDECGNLYVVAFGTKTLFRIALDAAGASVSAPVALATFPTDVANPVFARGEGRSPTDLYVTGAAGAVYRLDVGVRGAPITP
jgi:sugar lactone lactonase YvrE